MEILTPSIPIMAGSVLNFILCLLIIVGAVLIIIGLVISALDKFADESNFFLAVGISLTIGASFLALVIPNEYATGKYKTIIEITDNSKYQELVDNKYEFTKLYENRNIYEIVGDEVE